MGVWLHMGFNLKCPCIRLCHACSPYPRAKPLSIIMHYTPHSGGIMVRPIIGRRLSFFINTVYSRSTYHEKLTISKFNHAMVKQTSKGNIHPCPRYIWVINKCGTEQKISLFHSILFHSISHFSNNRII